jgi:P-type Ca2+ transporter type 2C
MKSVLETSPSSVPQDVQRRGIRGLESQDARRRLQTDGPNRLPDPERRGLGRIAIDVLREPMFLLLAASAAIYLALGDKLDALVLFGSLLVVLAITVFQARKSERSLEALRDLASPRALVVRDGKTVRIAGHEVVRGDLLVLNEGDRVPADGAVTDTAALLVDESLLTGESLSVAKQPGHLVYSGTLVVKGQGYAEVTATGARTAFGRIGTSLAGVRQERTHLELETARLVKFFAIAGLLLCVVLAAFDVARNGDWLRGLLSGLTLAMALVPEEFPVVLTIFLALGAWRIARHGVLTRRMPAIEMLGAATVLCVDKTGTLTENRMTVSDVLAGEGTRTSVLLAAAMASERDAFDPMERAILSAAGNDADAARQRSSLLASHPLAADFFAVCQIWASPDGTRRAYVKGAVETVLTLCAADDAMRQRTLEIVAECARRGLRLLGVAEADVQSELPESPRDLSWRWLGLVAFSDPLRKEVPEAVAQCRNAGIRVVMITGDHPGTALAIAAQAGISPAAEALTGADLDRLDDDALAHAVRHCNVFARISPEQKLRLVQAFKAAGEVVAMTGDGVNDAPALKAAHIGIAMGKRGTDVAREAAMLVLLEDDFASVVEAVRHGRRIYENIRNAMRYIIAVHVPIVGMAFLPLVFGWPPLLLPIHIVFLELVIDPACTVVFEAEQDADGSMNRRPRDPNAKLFAPGMLAMSLGMGLCGLLSVLAAYAWAVETGLDPDAARALGFAAIVFSNVALIHATRSREPVIASWFHKPNPALWWMSGAAVLGLCAAIYIPAVAALFRFGPLGMNAFAIALLAGVVAVAGYEWHKLHRARLEAAVV